MNNPFLIQVFVMKTRRRSL